MDSRTSPPVRPALRRRELLKRAAFSAAGVAAGGVALNDLSPAIFPEHLPVDWHGFLCENAFLGHGASPLTTEVLYLRPDAISANPTCICKSNLIKSMLHRRKSLTQQSLFDTVPRFCYRLGNI